MIYGDQERSLSKSESKMEDCYRDLRRQNAGRGQNMTKRVQYRT